MKLTGAVWKFPQDDINTDDIRNKIYMPLPVQEQAKHVLEGLDPEFAPKVNRGDIVVAGKNFGCGSSSPVQNCFMELGVAAIIAESFGRIFFRTSIGAGLMVMPCPDIAGFVSTGDRIEVDTESGLVRNLTTGKSLTSKPLPDFLRLTAELGGEKAYLMAKLGRIKPS